MESLFSINAIIPFITLFILELVLGIDNIIFISILAGKLPKNQQQKARVLGLSLAVITRLALLLSISWVISLTAPLFSIMGHTVSGRDLIFLLGGLFLIAKSTHEIHQKLEVEEEIKVPSGNYKFFSVIIQIILLDIVFSLDSVITAVGMVNDIPIMSAAVITSTIVMIFASGSISDFVHRHPTITMLALSFLVLIGVTLIAEGLGQHISKGYIYFAMGFSLAVEALNIRLRKKKNPVKLKK